MSEKQRKAGSEGRTEISSTDSRLGLACLHLEFLAAPERKYPSEFGGAPPNFFCHCVTKMGAEVDLQFCQVAFKFPFFWQSGTFKSIKN